MAISYAIKTVPGFPNYAVSTDGEVWSKRKRSDRSKWKKMRLSVLPNGRLRVSLWKNGIEHRIQVHRIVLMTFVGPCPEGMEARHFPDRDPKNCKLENLSWDTHIQNMADRETHGTQAHMKGMKNGSSKLTDKQVREIRRKYIPYLYSARMLAKEFGVHLETIYDVLRRDRWDHIK